MQGRFCKPSEVCKDSAGQSLIEVEMIAYIRKHSQACHSERVQRVEESTHDRSPWQYIDAKILRLRFVPFRMTGAALFPQELFQSGLFGKLFGSIALL